MFAKQKKNEPSGMLRMHGWNKKECQQFEKEIWLCSEHLVLNLEKIQVEKKLPSPAFATENDDWKQVQKQDDSESNCLDEILTLVQKHLTFENRLKFEQQFGVWREEIGFVQH